MGSASKALDLGFGSGQYQGLLDGASDWVPNSVGSLLEIYPLPVLPPLLLPSAHPHSCRHQLSLSKINT